MTVEGLDRLIYLITYNYLSSHCIRILADCPRNLPRGALKWNYDYYKEESRGAFKSNEPIPVTHCMDILRQQLTCATDVGVLGHVWW